MAKCYILIGVPGSGKSTWIHQQNFDWSRTVVASTDDYVDAEALRQEKTYSEIFKDTMPDAVAYMAKTVVDAVKEGKDIIWDQTSVTVPSRAKKFRMLPANYDVIAVVFKTPDEAELARRLASRPGKVIPKYVMESMRANWQVPTKAEGFGSIIHVG
jgi:predicted kinase